MAPMTNMRIQILSIMPPLTVSAKFPEKESSGLSGIICRDSRRAGAVPAETCYLFMVLMISPAISCSGRIREAIPATALGMP